MLPIYYIRTLVSVFLDRISQRGSILLSANLQSGNLPDGKITFSISLINGNAATFFYMYKAPLPGRLENIYLLLTNLNILF